ncbi:MAG TPA: hypothetical protein VHO48_00080, partial [Anaerolineaceae bacterium]|nr:hypothetical protein [Anaerolineaceae bacterium]
MSLLLTPPEGVAAQASKNYPVYLPIVTRGLAGWFEMINGIRAQAGLPTLAENALMSQGCFDHAR